eukprot:4521692-Alexandrium_andersonii.AAC.1
MAGALQALQAAIPVAQPPAQRASLLAPHPRPVSQGCKLTFRSLQPEPAVLPEQRGPEQPM